MKPYTILFTVLFTSIAVLAQPQWKLIKDKNSIKVFLGSTENSKFKSVRVQCFVDGTISKLVSILTNVNGHINWVYKSKKVYLLKQISPLELIYYTEADLPWPVSNRDGIYHLKMSRDYEHNILRINGSCEPDFIPKIKGIVRVPYSKSSWYVSQAGNKINIEYILEVDPGGSLPAWLVNLAADKGPFESFQKLSGILHD